MMLSILREIDTIANEASGLIYGCHNILLSLSTSVIVTVTAIAAF
jgi:hypothetical protein